MDIFPQDLSGQWYAALAQARLAASQMAPHHGRRAEEQALTAQPDPRPVSPLERFWMGGSGANIPDDPKKTAQFMGAMRARSRPFRVLFTLLPAVIGGLGITLSATTGVHELGALFAGEAVLLGSMGLLIPRFRFGRLHKTPLAPGEVESLLPQARDELERAYLTLVIDIVRQPAATIPAETQAELRQAISSLGDAIDGLPTGLSGSSPDADGGVSALRREADAALAEAANESDTVTRESLERQAEAIQRRADALEKMATSVRRASALRRELRAQVEALRAGLAGFQANATEAGELGSLAESVRRVATEASSIAEARSELDEAVAQEEIDALPNTATATPSRVGLPASAAQEEPVQTVTLRQNGA